VDAPVSGGVLAAAKGTLIVFAGGEAEALEALQPMLAAVSSRVTHMGKAGSGQVAKLCNQMIVSCSLMVIAETMAMARKIGLNGERLPDAFRGGFADSAPLQVFGPRMASRTFEPRLGAIGLMAKDTALIKAMSAQTAVRTPVLDLVQSLYAEVLRTPGFDAEQDISRLVDIFEQAPNPGF
jgi:3-hydroxyisobutyrate dehydrogenase